MKYYGVEMETIHPFGCKELTWEDVEKIETMNRECGYCFGASDLFRILADHMDASDNVYRGIPNAEAVKTRESIEWRLKDANIHELCKYLHEFDYEDAIKWVVADCLPRED